MAEEIKTSGETPQDNSGTQSVETVKTEKAATPKGKTTKKKETPKAETVKTETPQAAAPKVSDALVKAGRALLKSNPHMSMVYMTSDGQGFSAKNDAQNHAKGLKNSGVTTVERE